MSLLSVLARSFFKSSPSFPFRQQENSDITSYITMFGATSKNRASTLGSELGTEHWTRARERRAVFSLNVFTRWLISPGYSKVKAKHYCPILQMRNLNWGTKGRRDLPNTVGGGEGWSRIQAFGSSSHQTMVLLTQALGGEHQRLALSR